MSFIQRGTDSAEAGPFGTSTSSGLQGAGAGAGADVGGSLGQSPAMGQGGGGDPAAHASLFGHLFDGGSGAAGAAGGGAAGGGAAGGGAGTGAQGGVTPDMLGAAAKLGQIGGGTPLPEEVRKEAEPAIGMPLDGVRLHEGGEAGALTKQAGAGAVNLGKNIFFAPGRMNLRSKEGRSLLYEELAHFAQHGGQEANPQGVRLGATNSGAESEAQGFGHAIAEGQQPGALSTGHSPDTARRGEASVHQGIEMEAVNQGKGPDLLKNHKTAEPGQGTGQAGALEIYSGNWMRDFSQLKVPLIHNTLSGISKQPVNDPTGKTAGKIGARGAEQIENALLKAIAIMELGPRIAGSLVTQKNVSVYQPEHHLDNPMGTGSTDLLVREQGTLRQAAAPQETKDGQVVRNADAARDEQNKGSAVPGGQVDNPKLYEVSGAGLSNHIYNSVEWTKNEWMQAAKQGSTPEGRMHLGAGLHVIEDYFSHSNFIEVGLNSHVDWALAQSKRGKQTGLSDGFLDKMSTIKGQNQAAGKDFAVDTMFDKKAPQKPGSKGKARQAITTGSFGGNDTKVSLAHLVLPKLPKLRDAAMQTVDRIFALAPQQADSWPKIKAALGEDRPAMAFATVVDGLEGAGISLPVPTGLQLKWGEIPVSPGWFGEPWKVEVPTGVEVSTEQQGVGTALGAYGALYKSAQETIELVKTYTKYMGPMLAPLLKQIEAQVKAAKDALAQTIKGAINQGIYSLLSMLSGKDPKELEKQGLDKAIGVTDEAVEELEHNTSIESRLKNGDLKDKDRAELENLVGPVKGEKGNWSLDGAPPSHSEISKDHAPFRQPGDEKQEHPGEEDKHEHADGSLFYGLHRALALEADRHVLSQMQRVWAKSGGSLLGDGKTYAAQNSIGEDVIGKEAESRSNSEQARAKEEGMQHAQSDGKNSTYLAEHPEVKKLLDLADLFVSHPDDSTWWKGIFQGYIGAHEEEVVEHILARNKTGAQRGK